MSTFLRVCVSVCVCMRARVIEKVYPDGVVVDFELCAEEVCFDKFSEKLFFDFECADAQAGQAVEESG